MGDGGFADDKGLLLFPAVAGETCGGVRCGEIDRGEELAAGEEALAEAEAAGVEAGVELAAAGVEEGADAMNPLIAMRPR